MIGYVADGVVLVDVTGIVQLWNPAAAAITGLAAEAVLGRPLEEAIPGWNAARGSGRRCERTGSSTASATTLPIEIRGRELWLSVSRGELRRRDGLRVPRSDGGAPTGAAQGGFRRNRLA